MDICISRLTSTETQEFSDLLNIFRTVFSNENYVVPEKEYLQKLLSSTDFMVLIAKDGKKVIGGLTVYFLPSYYSQKPKAFIYDVGIHTDYQRKGIGKLLMKYITNYCKENKFEEAFVEAESDDLEAISFYHNTDYDTKMKAIQYTWEF